MVKFDPLSGTAHTIDDSTLWYSQTMQVRSPLYENIKKKTKKQIQANSKATS